MFNKKTAVLLATVSTLSLSGAANADWYILDSVTPGDQVFEIKYTGNIGQAVGPNVYAGMFNMAHESDSSLDFKAFCVDIFNTISVGEGNTAGPYDMFTYTDPTPAWTPLVESRVGYFFDTYGDQMEGNEAAFQLTLWEIINDRATSSFGQLGAPNNAGLANGQFQAKAAHSDGSTQGDVEKDSITLANEWITDVWKYADEDYGSSEYYDFTFYGPAGKSGPQFQTVMSWKNKSVGEDETPTVPEPGSLLLIGLGLFALATFTKSREEDNHYFAAMA